MRLGMARIVIVGGGQGAFQLASSLRMSGFGGEVTILGAEAHLPYYRPPLSKACLKDGVDVSALAFKPPQYYAQQTIAMHCGAVAVRIARIAKYVQIASGEKFDYDHLILATGMRPRQLSLDIYNKSGSAMSLTLRDVDDAQNVYAALSTIRTLGVIGGGYIGLEIAAAARARGIGVIVFEREDRILARVANPETSIEIAKLHERHGVDIRYGADIRTIDGGDAVSRIACNTNGTHSVDAVLTGIGGDPESGLALEAGLEVNGGIVTDSFGMTSDPSISAIGDCASFYHPRYGTHVRLESVPNVIEQAKAVAARLCGVKTAYNHVPWFWSDQYDSKLQSAGLGAAAEVRAVRREQNGGVAIFGLNAGRVVSVDALDSPRNYVLGRKLVEQAIQIDAEELADLNTDIAGVLVQAAGSTQE
jgi:3-phenylpropionate/trans-cinnamate dioxygenase ferredoxin reductase component